MGLDMYLKAHLAIYSWDRSSKPGETKINPIFTSVLEAAQVNPALLVDDFSIMYLELPVGYWRKANAIHRWFVQQIQDGVDECQETELDLDQLDGLYEACKAVLAAPADTVQGVAEEQLPTQGGFFFGPTDLSDPDALEWYLDGLRTTIEIIDRARKLREELKPRFPYIHFTYRASW